MDTKTLIAIIVPSVLAFLISVGHLVLAIYREQEKKKERIWDLARALLVANTKEGNVIDELALAKILASFRLLLDFMPSLSLGQAVSTEPKREFDKSMKELQGLLYSFLRKQAGLPID